jgi:excisionase family DNA binding protein
MERLTLTVIEAARLLGLSRGSAYQGVVTGQIPHIKIGKRILVPRRALEKLLEGNKVAIKGEDSSS